MACDCLRIKNPEEFSKLMRDRDIRLITKMVKCILNAKKKNKKKVDIFDVTFNDKSSLLLTIDENQYNELLSNYLKDLEKAEEYELCAGVMKSLNEAPKKIKKQKPVLVKDPQQ